MYTHEKTYPSEIMCLKVKIYQVLFCLLQLLFPISLFQVVAVQQELTLQPPGGANTIQELICLPVSSLVHSQPFVCSIPPL